MESPHVGAIIATPSSRPGRKHHVQRQIIIWTVQLTNILIICSIRFQTTKYTPTQQAKRDIINEYEMAKVEGENMLNQCIHPFHHPERH